jgi:hypothetical protein
MLIPSLQQDQVLLVMAIEAVVVAIVAPVSHDDIRVFLGNDEVLIRIEAQGRRFAFFMATVAIEVREIRLHLD